MDKDANLHGTRGPSTIDLALFVFLNFFKDAPGRSIDNVVDISRYLTKTQFVIDNMVSTHIDPFT